MKKLILLIIVAIMCVGCSAPPAKPPIAVVMLGDLTEYYYAHPVTGHRELMALHFTDGDVEKADISTVLQNPRTTAYEMADYLLCALILPDKLPDTQQTLQSLAALVADGEGIGTRDYVLSVFALYAHGGEVDIDKAVSEVLHRMDGKGYANKKGYSADIVSTSYAFMLFAAFPDALNADIYDQTLIYIGESITDINTLNNIAGESSCRSTAIALNAMLASGIPIDGEISTSLLTAMSLFEREGQYFDVEGDQPDAQTTAEVFLTVASANRGNLYLNWTSD